MIPSWAIALPGDMAGEFEDGRLVRLWTGDGKHRIERIGGRDIFAFDLQQDGFDAKLASVFRMVCSDCGRRMDHEWELTPAPRDRMLCPECAITRQREIAQGQRVVLGTSEYLKSSYSGTLYPLGTAKAVMQTLDNLRGEKDRIKVALGDPITGRDWQEEFGTTGYVTRTGGAHVVMLVHNTRSMGGSPLISECVVRITSSRKDGRLYYQHPNYHVPAEEAAS
jgi:hypothetical protein